LADLYLFIEDHEGARLQAEQALALAPDDARACHALGQAMEALGDHAAARTQYERAIQLDEKNEIYQLSLENLSQRPSATMQTGFATVASDAAVATPDAARSVPIMAPPNTPAYTVSQAAQALQSNQPELAIRIVRDGIAKHGDDAALYRTLGAAQYRQSDYRAAQAALRKSLSLDKSHPLSYFLLSATLKKLGDEEEAARCLAQAVELDPALAAWR
jgi:Flp pilus assembly protein TadD